MRLQLVILLILAVAGVFGVRAFPFSGLQTTTHFDYSAATPEERSKYLHALSRQLIDEFKPNYLAKHGGFSVGGRSITLTYKTHISKVDCDTDHSCNMMQCKRYLRLPVSKHNISVRLRYTNSRGQQIGTQLLKNSTCKAMIDKWKKRTS